MNVNHSILATNPFIDSYVSSDLFGKLIFLALFALSIISWLLIVYKGISLQRAKKNSGLFYTRFCEQQKSYSGAPLAVDIATLQDKELNPYLTLYQSLKKQAICLLSKNKEAISDKGKSSWLTSYDLETLAVNLQSEGAMQIKKLEENLHLLSTIVSLAPFLGLLGTVWGILITFSHMQQLAGSQSILEGLSLALTTTVLGLVDAIPALIGYNCLKNSVRDFRVEMDDFSNTLISAVEMEYRPVEVPGREEAQSASL